jgi:hypothetical protein
MKIRVKDIAAYGLILFLSLWLQRNYISTFPTGIHAWAQSDRYALALGFVDNGLDFFKPQTFVMNHQFPDKYVKPSETSVTAVDFPVHDYIPAVIMSFSGSTSPRIFRLYIMLYSILGLFFLFRLSMLLTDDYLKSVFLVIFALTSPVFAYYQAGFLPTIPSLANVFIGLYLYLKYRKTDLINNFALSILFLTLAALSRTTFLIPLLAVSGAEIIRSAIGRKIHFRNLFFIFISITVISIYWFYNSWLRQKYGSMFLGSLMPAQSIPEFFHFAKISLQRWFFDYFSIVHYILFVLAGSAAIIRIKTIKHFHIANELKSVLVVIALMLIGYMAFTIAMIKQFPDHDYYFLDTYYLPVVLLMGVFVSLISIPVKMPFKPPTSAAVMLIAIPFLLIAGQSQNHRSITQPDDRTAATIANFQGSSEFLDSLGISRDARIIVLDAYAPNVPFILLERKGYAIMSTKRQILEKVIDWDYDYLVFQNMFFVSDIYYSYPEIIKKLEVVADNGKITICKKLPDQTDSDLLRFLGLHDKKPVFSSFLDFETEAPSEWSNVFITEEQSFSGQVSGVISNDSEFGITFISRGLPIGNSAKRILHFSAYLKVMAEGDCDLVISLSKNGNNIYYSSYGLSDAIKSDGRWEKASFVFLLPDLIIEDHELRLYFWNRGGMELLVDDIELGLF